MALCPLWCWLLNSLIVGLMEEEIRFFWYCLTPQSPWLQHLWLANGLSGWRQGGVGLRDEENNGAECLSQHYLAAPLSLLLTRFFPSNKSRQPITALCCGGRIRTLYKRTHTYTRLKKGKKSVGVGWIVRQKKSKALSECNVKGAKSYSVTFNCSNPKEEMIAKKL